MGDCDVCGCTFEIIRYTAGLTGDTATFLGGLTGTTATFTGGFTGNTAFFSGGVTTSGLLNTRGGISGTTAIFTGGLTGYTATFTGDIQVKRRIRFGGTGSNIQNVGNSIILNGNCGINSDDPPRGVDTQGLWLQWNRGGGDGISYLINQKGTGVGGFSFGEATLGDTYTENMSLSSTGD